MGGEKTSNIGIHIKAEDLYKIAERDLFTAIHLASFLPKNWSPGMTILSGSAIARGLPSYSDLEALIVESSPSSAPRTSLPEWVLFSTTWQGEEVGEQVIKAVFTTTVKGDIDRIVPGSMRDVITTVWISKQDASLMRFEQSELK
ncbi:MAG: hypothetical protein AAFR91_10955 [Pseudomonadota bacterium]